LDFKYSIIATAIHSIIIKSSLKVVDGSTLDLVFYNNYISMVVFIPILFISGEANIWSSHLLSDSPPSTTSDDTDSTLDLQTLLIGGLITGFFGFLINIAGFFQIKVTSPVSHMISSAFRGVLQTFVAVAVFGDVVSSSRGLSIGLILVGSSLYACFKSIK
jgi:solute carrier family 35 (GDP-fucose transporter), member C1